MTRTSIPSSLKGAFSLEAEKCFLGLLICDAEAAIKAREAAGLEASDFFEKKHQLIFKTADRIYNDTGSVDLDVLTKTLETQNALENAGGARYLRQLAGGTIQSASAPQYAGQIVDLALLRRQLSNMAGLADESRWENSFLADMMDRAAGAVHRAHQEHSDRCAPSVGDLLPEVFMDLSKGPSDDQNLPSGFVVFDEWTGGLRRGELVILGGRPAMGKTALALNLAVNTAMPANPRENNGHNLNAVGIFSLDLSAGALIQRLLCQIGNIGLIDMERRNLSSADNEKMLNAIYKLEKAPIYIDDSPLLGVYEFRSRARSLKHKLAGRNQNLGLIIVDYLQLMAGALDDKESKQQADDVFRGLKTLARELDVVVLVTSQLSRAVERRKSKAPILNDLHGFTDAAANYADMIFFIYRPGIYRPDYTGNSEAYLKLERSRHSQPHYFTLEYNKESGSFYEADRVR